MRLSSLFQSLAAVLFPPTCVTCGCSIASTATYRVICDACFERVPIAPYPQCPTCERRLTMAHRRCHREVPFALFAAARFTEPAVRDLIHALKYGGIRSAAQPLADLIGAHLRVALPTLGAEREEFFIVPVPLYPRKARTRGLDQTALIARALAANLPNQCRVTEGAVVRVRDNGSQTEQPNREARLRNVRGCFAIADQERLRGANVLIIDDVCTSGATIAEVARVVRETGPKAVFGAVAARA
jgi:ComF family protein